MRRVNHSKITDTEILVVAILFLSWFGRSFEAEFFVSNMTACVRDVTANTETDQR
jgi:hypothetical protein